MIGNFDSVHLRLKVNDPLSQRTLDRWQRNSEADTVVPLEAIC